VSVCLPASGPDGAFCIAEGCALLAVVFFVKVSDKEQKTAADRAVSCRSLAVRTKHVHCKTNLTQPTMTQAAQDVTDFQPPALILVRLTVTDTYTNSKNQVILSS
jgi:hypothetical protein